MRFSLPVEIETIVTRKLLIKMTRATRKPNRRGFILPFSNDQDMLSFDEGYESSNIVASKAFESCRWQCD